MNAIVRIFFLILAILAVLLFAHQVGLAAQPGRWDGTPTPAPAPVEMLRATPTPAEFCSAPVGWVYWTCDNGEARPGYLVYVPLIIGDRVVLP